MLDVSKSIWEAHKSELVASGDLFYTWQYDVRWAAQKLRDSGVLVRLDGDRSGLWTLATESPAGGAGTPWSDREIAVVAESYFRMLEFETTGKSYNKAAENRQVVKAIGRGRAAVEFKYANISAVLDERGVRYVAGYKPRPNVQLALRDM